MNKLLLSLLLLFIVRSIGAQEYDDRAQSQWWSDYSSLDDYDDDDLDRHMNLIITKNILPGDAPLPFDESLFYRPQSSSSEEFEFVPPPSPLPRRNNAKKKNLIVSSTPPPPPPETFRPRPTLKASRKPVFRPALTRPPTPPPIDDVLEEEVEEEEPPPPPPSFARPEPPPTAILSDSQNVFVTRGTEAPKSRNEFNPNRFPVAFSEQPERPRSPQPPPLPPRSQTRVNPTSQTRPTFVSPPSTRLSSNPSTFFPSTFRPRQPDFSIERSPPPNSFSPNSAVFVPPENSGFTSRQVPITRQSLAPNEFFSSLPTTASFSTFESQTPQGRRTQVLKRRFRPSTQLIEETQTLPPPPSSPLPSTSNQFRAERRRVRINPDSNSFVVRSESDATKRTKKPINNINTANTANNVNNNVNFRTRVSASTIFEPTFSTFYPQPSTIGRLAEPQRIPTTFRPSSFQASTEPNLKKDAIRTNSVSPFVRRRPVVTTPSPPTFVQSPSPDVEIRGRVRVPVTTSIPQLFLSTPISAQQTSGEISSNTEIISPADLRQVARQHRREHDVSVSLRLQRSERSSTRLEKDEIHNKNAILELEGTIETIFGFAKTNSSLIPTCYDGRRSFCSYEEQYPRELMDETIRKYETELNELFRNLGIRNETILNDFKRISDDKFVCESVARIVRPGWVRDFSSGRWLVVINSDDDRFRQNIRIETCGRPNESCHFISPYYRSSCVERENLRRLVAIDPYDRQSKPFVVSVSIPCGCSCRIGSVTHTLLIDNN